MSYQRDIDLQCVAQACIRTMMYVELDSGGYVCAAGGRSAAALCARARLAPDALAAAALVSCARAGLWLRVRLGLAPHAELLLWFADDALAALDMPFLTPRNICGQRYACHRCGLGFDDPNPLKVHLFMSCAPYEPANFWREVAARLSAAPGSLAALPATAPGSHAALPATAPGSHAGPLAPAQLEALATEWGRARGGHVCVYCGKLYSRRYGLKIHLRTHTGYRPLRCRHCLRAFGDPSNLNKHERLHAAGRGGGSPARYSCALCGRALARRRDLERHVRTHTHAHAHTRTHTAKQ